MIYDDDDVDEFLVECEWEFGEKEFVSFVVGVVTVAMLFWVCVCVSSTNRATSGLFLFVNIHVANNNNNNNNNNNTARREGENEGIFVLRTRDLETGEKRAVPNQPTTTSSIKRKKS